MLPIAIASVVACYAQFAPGPLSPIGTGAFPEATATGDFNGDGKLDVVIANRTDNTVTVLLGDGLGGFTQAAGSPLVVGNGPAGIATGDLNNDGKLDFAVCNGTGNNVTVMLGDGKGGFTQATRSPIAVGTNPSALVLGYFSSHSTLDIATANSGSNNVTVLLGQGDGTFIQTPGSPFAVGSSPQYIAAGDFNGDNAPDLVTANFQSNNATVLLSNSVGQFNALSTGPLTTGSGPNGIAIGDLNGDSRPDIAIANFNSGTLTVLFSNGNGTFTLAPAGPFAVGKGPSSVAAADVNGDGKLDLISANNTSNNISVLLGNGTGGFTADASGPFTVGSGPTKVLSGDFDGDGQADLAVSNGISNNLTLLLNKYPAIKTPVIVPGGVVPLFSNSTSIQPSSWISIFGANLTDKALQWNGDFPTSLGGVTVTINGKSGYLWYVSPGQINLQAPDDTATGQVVDVVVTSALGTARSKVVLAAQSPSFSLLDGRHVAGTVARKDGSGAYGGGTYDILGPAGAFPFPTQPVQAGDTITIYGVGFGPTTPATPAGKLVTTTGKPTNFIDIQIGGASAPVTFAGVTLSGLFQFNVTVPNTAHGEVGVQALINSKLRTQGGPLLTIK